MSTNALWMVLVGGLTLIAAAQEGKAPVPGQGWTVPEVGLEMVWVAPGTLQMGSNDGEDDEQPVHEVRLTKGYWLGKYEVTQGEWQAVMGATVVQQRDRADRGWPLCGEGARYPIYYVSWDEASEFCRKVTERERAAGRLPVGYVYRLPTEAEWEYAARGGSQSKGTTYSGSNNLDEVAWYGQNSGYETHVVGGKQANELGLYDLSGNVWEWCYDWDGDYPAGPVTDPTGPRMGEDRVTRGGYWGGNPGFCRAVSRFRYRPGCRNYYLGLRLALPAGQ